MPPPAPSLPPAYFFYPCMDPAIMAAADDYWNPYLSRIPSDLFCSPPGDCPLPPLSKLEYHAIRHQFYHYCIQQGDYQSLSVSLRPLVPHEPSMRTETVDAFLRWRRRAMGSTTTTTSIMDIIAKKENTPDARRAAAPADGHRKRPRHHGPAAGNEGEARKPLDDEKVLSRRLQQLLDQVEPQVAGDLQNAMALMVEEAVERERHQRQEDSTRVGLADKEAPMFMPQTKKVRWEEMNDLPSRHDLKSLATTQSKIECMVKIYQSKAEWGTLTLGAKTFVSKHLSPTIKCLGEHFLNHVEAFAHRYPSFQHTTFPTICCNGKGPSCCSKEELEKVLVLIQQMAKKPLCSDDTNDLPPCQAFLETLDPPATPREKNDLPPRHEVKTLATTQLKLERMVQIENTRKDWGKLTPGAQSFVTKHLDPTMRCLRQHFHHNVEAFAQQYPSYQHTTFATKCCCGGKGVTCSPKK